MGLLPGDRVLLLGDGDLELETSLSVSIGGPVDRSADGHHVPESAYALVALSREVTGDRQRRQALAEAAGRALAPHGMLIAEFPSLLAPLARPLLAYEGLGSISVTGRGGTTYGGARGSLRRAGFARLTSCICLPSLADPRIVLPLDSSGALSYHYQPPFFEETWRRRLLRGALRQAARAGVLRVLSPGYVLLASRGGAT
ncbi:MAG: hypothetical protein PVF43_03500 [Candidatus Eiseniibacteriota bacterium]|jgi:hypothetical protein